MPREMRRGLVARSVRPRRAASAVRAPRRADADHTPRQGTGGWASVVSILRSAVLWIAAAIGAACLVLFLAATLFGIRPQIVISGSMEPQIPTGALVLTTDVAAGELQVGDVVTVPQPGGGGLVTHRIVDMEPVDGAMRLTLRGDANASADPDPYDVAHAGRVIGVVPGLGLLAMMLRTPFGIAGIVIFGVAVLLAFSVDIRRRGRRRR
ncbi:signal peptidase I [Homoserinibacter sp. GY 40078]|uniref:signal peptidase I n=1 Tax=Homoserinibacter sp. GY 40078 TaxID=2603275 RepID=UPI00164EFF40|nr:signal peptidase I [Homoserinibacter sp. GY 40078]